MTRFPKIVSARTTASADDALAVLSPTDTWLLTDVPSAILQTFQSQVALVCDYVEWTVIASTDADVMAAMSLLIDASAKSAWNETQPDTNGIICHWTETAGSVNDPDYFHANNRRGLRQVLAHHAKLGYQVSYVHQGERRCVGVSFDDYNTFKANLDAIPLTGDTVCYQLLQRVLRVHNAFE